MIDILIAQSDPNFIKELDYGFEKENYSLTEVTTVEGALDKFKEGDFDICLLDMEFKDGSGLDLKSKMNDIKDVPTIFVTKISEDIKKVLALEYGADDYIVRPFNILELKSRIRAVLRRYEKSEKDDDKEAQTCIVIDDFEFNIIGRRVNYKGNDLDLTGKEYDLLYVLISNPEKVFNRDELAEKIWGEDHATHLRTVDVHIRRLREKIQKYSKNQDDQVIKTKWGEGYYYGNEPE